MLRVPNEDLTYEVTLRGAFCLLSRVEKTTVGDFCCFPIHLFQETRHIRPTGTCWTRSMGSTCRIDTQRPPLIGTRSATRKFSRIESVHGIRAVIVSAMFAKGPISCAIHQLVSGCAPPPSVGLTYSLRWGLLIRFATTLYHPKARLRELCCDILTYTRTFLGTITQFSQSAVAEESTSSYSVTPSPLGRLPLSPPRLQRSPPTCTRLYSTKPK